MKVIYKFAAAALGLFIAGCNDSSNPPNEYGVPSATYNLSGTVKSSTTSNPIEGIQITIDLCPTVTTCITTSSATGEWSLNTNTIGPVTSITATDIDGTTNGAYQTTQVTVSPTQTIAGSGTWDQGTFEQTGIDVTMTPQ